MQNKAADIKDQIIAPNMTPAHLPSPEGAPHYVMPTSQQGLSIQAHKHAWKKREGSFVPGSLHFLTPA